MKPGLGVAHEGQTSAWIVKGEIMGARQSSRSAIGVTMARAWESNRPPDARVCYDPFAIRFITGKPKFLCKMMMRKWPRLIFNAIVREPVRPAIVGYVPLRTRFIDEQVLASIRDGLEQLVILGAGYDSRAYRFDELRNGVKVFEVDHPATQASKLDRLKEVVGAIPEHVVHVSVDFETQDLEERLRQNGYKTNRKTLFIWEGVTYYLEADAVDQTLAFVANRSKPGSSIVFDYLLDDVLDGTSGLPLATDFLDFVEKIGEPCKFGIQPLNLDAFLSERGFRTIEHVSVEQCKQAYHTPAHEGASVLGIFSMVHAEVLP